MLKTDCYLSVLLRIPTVMRLLLREMLSLFAGVGHCFGGRVSPALPPPPPRPPHPQVGDEDHGRHGFSGFFIRVILLIIYERGLDWGVIANNNLNLSSKMVRHLKIGPQTAKLEFRVLKRVLVRNAAFFYASRYENWIPEVL